MRLPLSVLVLCTGVAVAWNNGWDGTLYKTCSTGESFVRVSSVHDNKKEDRRYLFVCARHARSSSRCYWTSNYVNDFDGEMNFRCNSGYVVSGVDSYHSNSKEDRRFKFKCCEQTEYRQAHCHMTSFINDWDGYMEYTVPPDSVIRGFYSEHANNKEDRRWKVYICRLG